LRSDGTLWIWGDNTNGQLGDSTQTAYLIPKEVLAPAGARPGTRWTQIALGVNHTLAMRSDSTLWAWGANYWSQLGDHSTQMRLRPVQIYPYRSGDKWTSVTASDDHALGLTVAGDVLGWGRDHRSQLGLNSTYVQSYPVPAMVIPDNKRRQWAQIATGEAFSLGLTTEGELWASGDNFSGQLGGSVTPTGFAALPERVATPVSAAPNSSWTLISARGSHALALRSDGSLWSWGENYDGQLGINSTTVSSVPVQEFTRHHWTWVAAGASYALALDGRDLYATGANEHGQLGNGTGQRSLIFRTSSLVLSSRQSTSATAYGLWPNPAHDQVHLTGLSRESRLYLLDNTGRVLHQAAAGSTDISLAGLAPGLYLVQVHEAHAAPRTLRLLIQ
jgi:alpha-tubulin suppressor-like RCC1 family protein